MITEDYVSFEVAKLLKEKGFTEMCSRCYGISVRHNGKDIDEDEEYELKSNGKGNEIEYVDGGQPYCMHDNNSFSSSVYAAPTLQMAMKWLRKVHKIFIAINIIPHTTVTMEQKYYFFKLFKDRRPYNFPLDYSVKYYPSYEEAIEAALKYSLKNLI